MPNYRRAFVPGGCWFFTANLLERRSNLLVDKIDAFRKATVTDPSHRFAGGGEKAQAGCIPLVLIAAVATGVVRNFASALPVSASFALIGIPAEKIAMS